MEVMTAEQRVKRSYPGAVMVDCGKGLPFMAYDLPQKRSLGPWESSPLQAWRAAAKEIDKAQSQAVAEKPGDMRLRDLVEHLWRLAHNTMKGYHVELFAGGEISLMLEDEVVFRSKSVSEVADKMRSLSIPARVTLELSREQAEELQTLVGHGKEYFMDHDAVEAALALALQQE